MKVKDYIEISKIIEIKRSTSHGAEIKIIPNSRRKGTQKTVWCLSQVRILYSFPCKIKTSNSWGFRTNEHSFFWEDW